jgi:hypothetical protein
MYKMSYFKRIYSEVITRFNKDWSTVDTYYFEVNEKNYAEKQIVRNYEGKVFKYDNNNLQDENGSLAEGSLNLQDEQYEQITKEAFYALWDKPFNNTYLIKQLQFDTNWKFAWYNIDYNKTEQELYNGNLILCGTYKDIFLLEIEYKELSNYLMYSISEGSANIKYSTVDNWDELVRCVQLWINYMEKNAETIYSKPEAEKIERLIKMLVDGALKDASFSMYRNMDWDVEKFRGAYLFIENENYAHINTYIGVEDLMIALQEGLPRNIQIKSCFFCKFSNYNVAGNDNFGDLNCFKHCKEKCSAAKTKNDIIDLFESEFNNSKKVEETFYCKEFEAIQEKDFVYKSQIK